MAKFVVGNIVRLVNTDKVKIFEIIAMDESDGSIWLEPLAPRSFNKILIVYENDIILINSSNIELLRILYD